MKKAKVTVESSGDYQIINVKIGEDTYGVKTDDGALGAALDILIEMILEKQFGMSKHELLKEVLKVRGIR